jgi:hypothetical protein
MNTVTITGQFDRQPEVRSIDRPTGAIDLATGSLNFTAKRGEKDVKMWIDVEAVGKKSFELSDCPLNVELTITGSLERAAWQDKQTGEWRSKHFIRFTDAEYAVAASSEPTQEDIPF